jgi:3-oxoacyl-[acyl-carrier protein] reductase
MRAVDGPGPRPGPRDILVTGGATGIGRAVAARFTRTGDRVTILGRRRDVLESAAAELGPTVRPVACDLTDPDAVEEAARELPAAVDVLVNNAGSRDRQDRGAGLMAVLGRWQSDFDRNVMTAVLITEAVAGRLASPGGRVVTISSLAALRGNDSYGAAKAALLAWNHSLARRLGPDGITANVVVPGFVADTEFFGEISEAELARRATDTLVRRVGYPDDVAAAVEFLASPGAGYVTGEFLQCNGGAMLGR